MDTNIQSASQVSTLVPNSAFRAGKIAPVEPVLGAVNANQASAEPTGAPVVEAAAAPQAQKPAAPKPLPTLSDDRQAEGPRSGERLDIRV